MTKKEAAKVITHLFQQLPIDDPELPNMPAETVELPAKKRMKRPDLKEVTDYFASINQAASDAEHFYDYFQSNGWYVSSRLPMKDWQAAARNWCRRIQAQQADQRRTRILNAVYSPPLPPPIPPHERMTPEHLAIIKDLFNKARAKFGRECKEESPSTLKDEWHPMT